MKINNHSLCFSESFFFFEVLIKAFDHEIRRDTKSQTCFGDKHRSDSWLCQAATKLFFFFCFFTKMKKKKKQADFQERDVNLYN